MSSIYISRRYLATVLVDRTSHQDCRIDYGGQSLCLSSTWHSENDPGTKELVLKGVDGKLIDVHGIRNIIFQIGKFSYKHSFPLGNLAGIIGVYLLQKMGPVVDFKAGKLTLDNDETLHLK